ncbi:hypothetical protein JHK84_027469 [Glycine max]|nr:hypothetical protein JHK84_027469 [Glycine max]
MSDKKGSTSNHGLNLNIPPPRVANQIPDSPTRLPIAPPTSPTSSCVSSELSLDDNSSSSSNNNNNRGCTRSPEDISMVLVGCSRCLMYMMVNEGGGIRGGAFDGGGVVRSAVVVVFVGEGEEVKKANTWQ